MNRRALGRGRLLVIVGSIVTLVGLVPSWWVIERTNLPPLSGNGFQSLGMIIFLACLMLLALVVLPFTSRERESVLDRPPAYVLLAVLAIGAFLWRLYEISQFNGLGLPMQSPGLWLAGVGLLIVAWGVGDILTERPPTY